MSFKFDKRGTKAERKQGKEEGRKEGINRGDEGWKQVRERGEEGRKEGGNEERVLGIKGKGGSERKDNKGRTKRKKGRKEG